MLVRFFPLLVLLGLLLADEETLDGGCMLCHKTREMRAKDRISAILKAILEEVPMLAPLQNVANFKRQNDPSTQHAAIAAMFPQLKQSDDGFENRKVIAMSQPGLSSVINLVNVIEFKFNVNSWKVESAMLNVYVRGDSSGSQSKRITLQINKVFVTRDPEQPHETVFYSERQVQVSSKRSRLVTVEVKSLFDDHQFVEQLIQMETVTLLIQVLVKGSRSRTKQLLMSSDHQDLLPKPFIELTMKAGRSNETSDMRRRRNTEQTAGDCEERSNSTRCCRYPLEVDFNALGFNYVIAPRRFRAFQCYGKCSINYFPIHPTNYISHDRPGCCAPAELSALELLYFDEEKGHIVNHIIPDIIVKRCGCS